MTVDPWRELLCLIVGLAVVGIAAYRKGQESERDRCMSLPDQVWMSGRYSPSIGVVRDAVDSGAERIEQSQIRPHDRDYRAHLEDGAEILRMSRPTDAGYEASVLAWLKADDQMDVEREKARKRRVGL